MVLSNKKLKQKIREDLVKSLSVSVSETNTDTVQNLESQSLKKLFDSASHKPRLSKREKRRNTDTRGKEDELSNGIQDEHSNGIREMELESDVANDESGEKIETTNIKKRKREDTVEGELGEAETKEEEKPQKKKTKKKKKKKKKRKANKTEKKAEEANVEEKVKVEEEIKVDIESNEDGVVPKKLYVGGIPYHSTEDEIRSYFRSCGVITKVDCKMQDGEFSGIAFITFETEDGANRALALDRAAMGDRYLTIQQYVKTTTPSIPRRKTSNGFAPEMVDGYNRVYIGNLAWDTTERDIRKLFSDCVIVSVRLGKNKETGEFKGYAHVDFKDSVSLALALKLDQQVICGRPVKICCALKERPVGDNTTDLTPDETNMEETYAADPVPGNGNYFAATVSSGKVKRRVCYECGEKGHLSTACPKKLLQNVDDHTSSKLDQETINAGPAMQENNGGSYYMNERDTVTYEANNESLASEVSIGKIKRRTCYECGEKGHLSSACPKKIQYSDHTNSKLDHQTVEAEPIQLTSYNRQDNANVDETYANDPIPESATNGSNEENITSAVSIGKIKRRTCYECGERGHLSSACLKKQQKQG